MLFGLHSASGFRVHVSTKHTFLAGSDDTVFHFDMFAVVDLTTLIPKHLTSGHGNEFSWNRADLSPHAFTITGITQASDTRVEYDVFIFNVPGIGLAFSTRMTTTTLTSQKLQWTDDYRPIVSNVPIVVPASPSAPVFVMTVSPHF